MTLPTIEKTKGFTLIELLVVVAIIGIIAAIAIPNLLRSRMSSNEAATMGACKTILVGQTDYNNNTHPHSYAQRLQDLLSAANSGGVAFMDPNLASGLKSGYTFTMVAGSAITMPNNAGVARWSFSASAWPVAYKSSGIRTFYVDESGIIRGSDIGGAVGTFEIPALQ